MGIGRVAFDVALPRALGWYVLVALLTAAATFAVGATITAISPTTRAAQAVAMVVGFPLMFTAGLWFPVQSMSGWLHYVVTMTPLGAATEALNAAQLGQAPQLADIAVVLGWTAVLMLVAVRLFRWE